MSDHNNSTTVDDDPTEKSDDDYDNVFPLNTNATPTTSIENCDTAQLIKPATSSSSTTIITTTTSNNTNNINSRISAVNTDDEKLTDGSIVTTPSALDSNIESDNTKNGALHLNCDSLTSVESSTTINRPPIAFPKPILNNNSSHTNHNHSNSSTSNRSTSHKKSVSFDTDDEKILKFINGEVINDQPNPFKSLTAVKRAEFFNDTKSVILPPDEFITTADVLKESKYVKTYVKNPDKYFEFDPTIKQKLIREDEGERRRNIPVRKSRISKITNERLKELKTKYSPTAIYGKTKSDSEVDVVDYHKDHQQSYLSRNRSIDRSRYPDLSQIKVKVGTDLDESLFDADEVALNAKKFDNRIKNSSFGSQDDLDDITDLTSNSLESELEHDHTVTSEDEPRSNVSSGRGSAAIENPSEELPKKSFTNTVNSREFQEFLTKKGLSLIPQSGKFDRQPNGNHYYSSKEDDEIHSYEMEASKKVKKPSVLQRLFPSRMFSSKRRTTPKEPSPEPKNIYGTTSEGEISTSSGGIKRVVLERQSFHAGHTSFPANKEITKQQNLRDRSRKPSFMDDGSSSISSALTNAENYVDMNQPVSSGNYIKQNENKENYIEMKANWKRGREESVDRSTGNLVVRRDPQRNSVPDGEQPKLKPTSRIRTSNGRSSVPVMGVSERLENLRVTSNSSTIPMSRSERDQPVSFQTRSPDVRDGIVIKPRVQRPNIPVSNIRLLPERQLTVEAKIAIDQRVIKPPVAMRRTAERQSLNYRKPSPDESSYGNLNRAVSMDKAEMKRRSACKPLIRAKPINLQYISPAATNRQSTVSEQISQETISSDKTPHNSNDNLLGGALISTSTPIATTEQPNFYFHKKTSNISPISPPSNGGNSPLKKLEMDPYSWAKIRELKEQTDRQLYSKPLLIQTGSETAQTVTASQHAQPIYGRTIMEPPRKENIYEKLPLRDKSQSVSLVMVPDNDLQQQYLKQQQQLQQQYHQQQQMQQQIYQEQLLRQKQQQQEHQLLLKQKAQQRLVQQQQQQKLEQFFQQQQMKNQNGTAPDPRLHVNREPQQHFVRNSSQRNTISDIYRSRDLRLIDENDDAGFSQLTPLNQANPSRNGSRQLLHQPADTQSLQAQQPPRSQSVLDDMINRDTYGSLNNHRGSPNPVVMRRKQTGTLSREEIMNRVTEFCRKSMNRTPTKHLQGSVDELNAKNATKRAPSSEISPVSYTSLDSRATQSVSSNRSSGSNKLAPQVPQRVQSLQQKPVQYTGAGPESPIYAPVHKRSSIQSSIASDGYDSPVPAQRHPVALSKQQVVQQRQQSPRQQYASDSDSVIFVDPTKQASPSHYYVMDSKRITPSQVISYQMSPLSKHIPTDVIYASRQSVDQYGRIYPPEDTYDSLPPPQPAGMVGKNSQIYYPVNGSLRRCTQNIASNRLSRLDGRSTPLVLHAIPQQSSGMVKPTAQQPIMKPQQAIYSGQVAGQPVYAGRTGTIVVLDNVEQMYRPIVPSKMLPTAATRRPQQNYVRSGKYIVPYESESASEAEEVQRIMQTKPSGK